MSACFWSGFVLLTVILWPETTALRRASRVEKSREFLFYRTNSISQRPCTCATTSSCSCCETVTLIYTKVQRTLCSNFVYQRNGLNVDISLNTATIRTTTVTVYRPFKLCSAIPGSIFSSICVNVLELNQFPRSLTICVRHEIVSKTQEWQLNYTCMSISTELPMMENMMMTTTATSAAMTMKPSTQMTTASTMMTMMMMTMASTGSGGAPSASPSPPPTTGNQTSATSAGSSAGGGMGSTPPGPPAGGQMGSMPPGPPPGGQMGSMPPSPPPAGGGGMGIEAARRRRHISTNKFDQISIINDRNHIRDLYSADLRKAKIDSWAASSLSQTVTSSSSSVASESFPLPLSKNHADSILPDQLPVRARGTSPSGAIRGARKMRHVPGHRFYKSSIVSEDNDPRARIVNDNNDPLNSHFDDSMEDKIDALWALSDVRQNMTISSPSVVNQRFPTLSDDVIKSNGRPLILEDTSVSHDRTEYLFPSRIPPVVAESLEIKSKINSYQNLSEDSVNTFLIMNGTSEVIFPN